MPTMTEKMAREIIDAAIKTEAWGEAGETATSISADTAFREAEALVNVSRQVYDQKTAAGEDIPNAVAEILFAAQVEPVDGKFTDIYERKGAQPPSSNGSAPSDDPAEQEIQARENVDIESIYPGYDDQKAKDIVEAVKASAASGDLTPEEWEQIKAYEEANEERKSILSLEPEFKPKEAPPATSGNAQGGFQQGGLVPTTGTVEPSDYADAGALGQAYEDGSLGTDRVSQERLPVPSANVDESATLPVDITSISDQNLSRLIMTFHSLEARTLWLLSQEEGRQEACKALRHDSHRASFARELERLKSGIDTSKITHVEEAKKDASRLADDDKSVKTWRNREVRHSIEARSLKALSDGYGNAAARLSRELTRRTELRQTPTGG